MLIQFQDGLLVRPDAQLHDKEMPFYNRKTRQKEERDWSQKDWPLARIQPALLQAAGSWDVYTDHFIPEATPISNQGRAGTCVANAWCDMLEILDGLEGADAVEQLSRRFLYWIARYLTGDTDRDDGTFLRSAAHQLTKIGVVEEKWFEYSDDPDYLISGGKHASPELDLYTMASNNRIKAFYKPELADSLESYLSSLEVAVRSNHPVVFGSPVSRAFTEARGMQVFGPPDDSEVIGWHAMIIVGVAFDGETRRWLLRNSWGKGWGENGHIKVTDDYVLAFRDLWVGTRMGELK